MFGGRQARCRDSHYRAFRAHWLDAAGVAFVTPVVADLQMQGPVAGRRLACFYAFPAAVAKRFIDCIFVVVVVRIFDVDFPDYLPLERILRTSLTGGKPLFIRHACHIKIGGTKLAVSTFREFIYRLDR